MIPNPNALSFVRAGFDRRDPVSYIWLMNAHDTGDPNMGWEGGLYLIPCLPSTTSALFARDRFMNQGTMLSIREREALHSLHETLISVLLPGETNDPTVLAKELLDQPNNPHLPFGKISRDMVKNPSAHRDKDRPPVFQSGAIPSDEAIAELARSLIHTMIESMANDSGVRIDPESLR